MPHHPRLLFLAALLATGLTITGCASTGVASTPANVAVAAEATPELSTFSKLVKQAGMEAQLSAAGPVTVFAPTDDAFKALPAALQQKLAQDSEYLKSVLSYHVVPGLVKSTDIEGSKSLTSAAGAKLSVSKAGDFVTVDDSLVVKADVASGNGVIHVIDRVLTPPKK